MISKTETVRQKLGITNQNQNREVITNPQQHEKCCKEKGYNDCLPNSIGEPSPKKSFQTQTECDAQLTELRVEEHHEERVGTNIL